MSKPRIEFIRKCGNNCSFLFVDEEDYEIIPDNTWIAYIRLTEGLSDYTVVMSGSKIQAGKDMMDLLKEINADAPIEEDVITNAFADTEDTDFSEWDSE